MTAATLVSITVVDPVVSVAKGTTAQFTATGNFTDGSTQDLTTQVSWTSGDNTIAVVDNASGNQGLVTGINLGTTTIMATLNGIQGSATVTVSAAILKTITVGPPDPSIAKGTTVQLTATGNFSDGTTETLTSQVSWTSGDNTIAVVSNASGTQGVVTGLSAGNTPVTATLNGIAGSTTVTVTQATLVSMAIAPINPSIANGTTVQLTVTGTFTDGTTQDLTQSVSWTSAPLTVGQVSPTGLVTGTGVGSATITATQGGISGSTTVPVSAATVNSIAVTPANPSIPKGITVRLSATCTFSDGTTPDCTSQVSWTSSNIAIAQVSNVSGSQGWLRAWVSETHQSPRLSTVFRAQQLSRWPPRLWSRLL